MITLSLIALSMITMRVSANVNGVVDDHSVVDRIVDDHQRALAHRHSSLALALSMITNAR